MYQLADCLDEIGQEDKALEICKQIVDEQKNYHQELQNKSASVDDIIDAMKGVAAALDVVGDYDKEIDIREQVVDLYRKDFRANPENKDWNWNRYISEKYRLADCLKKTGQEDKALEILKQIVDEQKNYHQELQNKSASVDDIIGAIEEVAAALNAVGDYDEEISYRLDLVAFIQDKELKSLNVSGVAGNIERLIDFYSEHDQKDKALDFYKQIIDKGFYTKNYPEIIAKVQEKINNIVQTDESKEISSKSETESSELLTLCKGQRIDLTKNNPALEKLTFEFHWESDTGLDIDASAFLLGANGKVHVDEDFVFYGNLRHNSESVELDNSALRIELKKIPDEVEKVAFTLTIYEAFERKQNFGMIRDAALKIIGEQKEIAIFPLENLSTETALIVCEIYRHKGDWKFKSVGAGFDGGLKILCQKFGVEVD